MSRGTAKPVALGGLLAAMAVVIMCLGGLIPVATYVCPVLCMLLGFLVLRLCGGRIAWAWYGAVSVLTLLLGTDKEAAAIYLFLGYYPNIKPWLDRLPLRWVWKTVYFNIVVLIVYTILIHLMGMDALAAEFSNAGSIGLIVIVLLGNFTFHLLDRLLGRLAIAGRRKNG